MENGRRKKNTIPLEADDDSVQVRVSARAPRSKDVSAKRLSTPPAARARNLATAMLEGVIGQLAGYVENSHAVEKLIRAQTRQVLRELARDPQLTTLIRAQGEQYLAELAAHPEILEPIVRVQVDRYLDHLLRDPARLQAVAEKIKKGETSMPVTRQRKPRARKVALE
jgi:hypothetical protein